MQSSSATTNVLGKRKAEELPRAPVPATAVRPLVAPPASKPLAPMRPCQGRLPLPASLKTEPAVKKTPNQFTFTSNPVLPCHEMYDLMVSQHMKTQKAMVLDYWMESLKRENTLQVVEVVDRDKSFYILSKNDVEFTTTIVTYHEICYYMNITKDGQPTKVGACGYIFETQNSLYLVKHPIGLGRMSLSDLEKRNRELDDAEAMMAK
jgi:hypothetical protein